MKCPHCNYTDEYNKNAPAEPNEDRQGDFYKLPIKMEREDPHSYYSSVENVPVIGCPSCRKVFLGGKW